MSDDVDVNDMCATAIYTDDCRL